MFTLFYKTKQKHLKKIVLVRRIRITVQIENCIIMSEERLVHAVSAQSTPRAQGTS